MQQLYTHRFVALGGPCTFKFYAADRQAEAIALAAEREVQRIHQKYSRYRPDSLISRINTAAGSAQWIALDEESQSLVHYADVAFAQSDGLFDISSGVLRRAWDFKQQRPPEQASIDALLPLIGWQKVERQKDAIRLPLRGMEIDFGGFGKEYAADRAASVLRQQQIEHGLVDLSGDIHVLGPHPDGQAWQIGIQHPRQSGAIRSIALHNGAIASSGDYERSFVFQGRRYSHILHPQTGWPVNGLASVSSVAPQCLIAGTASTCAMLQSENEGLTWLRELGLPFLAVDQKLHIYEQDSPAN